MPMTPYPLRQTDEQRESVKRAAELVKLPVAEVMRKAIDFGLPIVVRKMGQPEEVKI